MRSPLLDRAAASVAALRGAEETGFYGVDRPGVAWDWMKQTGQAPAGADWVRPQVAEAWARCVDDHALPPGAEFAPLQRRLESGASELDGWRRNSLGGVAGHLSALVYDLRTLLDETNVALLLADPAGAVVHLLDSGSRITAGGAQIGRIGADWSEASLGNNGVGTASLLREPVAFDGKEHFNGALHRFATAGCPIVAPDGGLCAILGMISDRRDAAKLALGFLKIARHMLEASLFDRLAADGYLLRLRAIGEADARFADEGRVFVGADGYVRGVDRAAVEALGGGYSALVGARAATALGVDLPALIAAHEGGRILSLPDRNGRPLYAEAHRCPRRDGAASSARRAPDRADAAPCGPDAERDWSDSVLEAALRKAAGLQERNIPILITGESGVGKDYLVRRLHAGGPRKERPLVAINCAAIPRELIESELFGYEGGSFTGARAKGKSGKFVEADKGILFLDEIGDMAADLQATLLRVLDSSEVVPIGSSKPIRVDVRVVAATNRSLQEMVQKGAFRRDLYYRLNGVQLWLPPLRERPDRLGLLAQLFRLERDALGSAEDMRFSDEVWRIFFKHPWPGNIREARNVLRSSIAVAKGPVIELDDLPIDFLQELDFDQRVTDAESQDANVDETVEIEAGFDLSDWEARAVRHALASSKGNIAKAARSLGITRATLYHKMARYGLRSDRRIVSKR